MSDAIFKPVLIFNSICDVIALIARLDEYLKPRLRLKAKFLGTFASPAISPKLLKLGFCCNPNPSRLIALAQKIIELFFKACFQALHKSNDDS